jgi:hypothetical protein
MQAFPDGRGDGSAMELGVTDTRQRLERHAEITGNHV